MTNLEQQGQLFIYANDPVRGWLVSPVDTASTLPSDANMAIDQQFSQDLPFRYIPSKAPLVLHNRVRNDWIVAFKPSERKEWRGILLRDDAYASFERNPYAVLDHFATSLALSDCKWPAGWGSAPLFPTTDQQLVVRTGSDYLMAARKAYEAAAASTPSTYYSALPLNVPPGRSPLSVFRFSKDDDDWGAVCAVDSSVDSGTKACSSDERGEAIEVSTTANTQVIKEFRQEIDALIQTRRKVSAQLKKTTKELRHITLDLDQQRRQLTEWHQNQLASDREPNSVNADTQKDFFSLHEEIAALREQLNQVSQTIKPPSTDHRWKTGLIIVFFILSAAGFAVAAYYAVTLNDQLADVNSAITGTNSELSKLNSELSKVSKAVQRPTTGDFKKVSIDPLLERLMRFLESFATKLDSLNRSQPASPSTRQQKSPSTGFIPHE